MLCDIGNGVPRDPEKAWELIQLAAHGGALEAQFDVGQIYSKGEEGVVKCDLVLAYMWLSISAKQGHEAAERLRREVAIRMTPAQISEGWRLCENWKQRDYVLPFKPVYRM
jgi:TPR repeat protein